MIYEVKARDDRGFEVLLQRRNSFLDAVHDVFALSGNPCAIDVFKEEGLTRNKVMRITVY